LYEILGSQKAQRVSPAETIGGIRLESGEFEMEMTEPRPLPVHVGFTRLKHDGSLIDEAQVKMVMAQWVKAHALPYVNLHINETVLVRQVVPGHTMRVPGFMIVGYVSTTEEKVLPQTRDLALRLCATFDCKDAHILFGAHREQVTRTTPQPAVSERVAKGLSLPEEEFAPQQTGAESAKPSSTHARKLN
jgi:hypothetical protein